MIDYSVPGPLTELRPDQVQLAESLPRDPRGICKAVQSLVIQPRDAPAAGIPDERIPEKNLRSAAAIVDALIAEDPRPLSDARTAERRVVGTCRHFATLATALLRLRGVPARARCGFGAYFVKGQNLDHWVIEYRPAEDDRWIRLDVENLDRHWPAHLDDLQPGEFLTGGEAWQWYRTGEVDGDLFGVGGPDPVWGPGEIRGNAIRDLAALNKVEMLPWDEWSRMDDSYQGRTGPDFDALMDEIAATTDPESLYQKEDLAVPEELIN
ncbi:transglutaminase-like domain-containing protein [Kribbella qitaiheensis]|uniref:transglutaminase-like domain-containing protein n=1 Tax=Kribbella qitaiheensis TaxID=1544730 RepID=UPI00360FACB3